MKGKWYWQVVDFKQINKKKVADKFPLSRFKESIDKLGRNKRFLPVSGLPSNSSRKRVTQKITTFTSNSGACTITI